jgi:hypothetical protein
MEDTGLSLPLQRQPLREMKTHVKGAMAGTFDPSSDQYVEPENRTRADIRQHTFDFNDAMRLTLSRHHTEKGVVIHGQCQWFEKKAQPMHREDGLKVMLKRMARLIEGLDHVDRCPDPIDADVSENGVPHAFFPYPSPIFDPTSE